MTIDNASTPPREPFVLTVSGLSNSRPGHWQTLREQPRADCWRVELGPWGEPHRNSWVNQLNLAFRAALPVAPPEAERSAIDQRLAGFAPVPRVPLPFAAMLAASRNDLCMNIRSARALAQAWDTGFADAGAIGHTNAASDTGGWGFGQFLLGQLLKRVSPPGRPPVAQRQMKQRGW